MTPISDIGVSSLVQTDEHILARIAMMCGYHPREQLIAVYMTEGNPALIKGAAAIEVGAVLPTSKSQAAAITQLNTAVRSTKAKQVFLIAYTYDPMLGDQALQHVLDSLSVVVVTTLRIAPGQARQMAHTVKGPDTRALPYGREAVVRQLYGPETSEQLGEAMRSLAAAGKVFSQLSNNGDEVERILRKRDKITLQEAAKVAVWCHDPPTREHVLHALSADTATIANGLTHAAAYMPNNPEVASLLGLAAVANFLDGDGVKGNVFAERGIRVNPDNSTVQLARTVSFASHHIAPEQLLGMLARAEQTSSPDSITNSVESTVAALDIPGQLQQESLMYDAAPSL